MKASNFRVPVICQNGHRALWYFEIYGIAEVKSLGIPKNLKCDCPKSELGQGYSQCGPIQNSTGFFDDEGNELFDGDILSNSFMDAAPGSKSVIFWSEGYWALRVRGMSRPMGDMLGWCSMREGRYGGILRIGNTTDTPELIDDPE